MARGPADAHAAARQPGDVGRPRHAVVGIAAVGVEPAADGRLLVEVEPDRVRDLRVNVTAPGDAVKTDNTPITVVATDVANGETLSVGEHFFAPK